MVEILFTSLVSLSDVRVGYSIKNLYTSVDDNKWCPGEEVFGNMVLSTDDDVADVERGRGRGERGGG